MLQQLADAADDDKELEEVRYRCSSSTTLDTLMTLPLANRRQRAIDDVAWMQHETQRLLELERQREEEIDELYQYVEWRLSIYVVHVGSHLFFFQR
jgi:hypothetical protein